MESEKEKALAASEQERFQVEFKLDGKEVAKAVQKAIRGTYEDK